MELTHFKSLTEAANCAADELTRLLDEDIERMTWADDASYTAEERCSELARLQDLKTVLLMMATAPALLVALKRRFDASTASRMRCTTKMVSP